MDFKKISEMTLEEKVGQLFLFAFAGKDLHDVTSLIEEHFIGGCYISQENAETPEEAYLLSLALQEQALKSSGIPLLLGVDQEGTWGVLVPCSVTGPGNLGLGAAGDGINTEEAYKIIGKEMKAVGYNTILAPCADINVNPKNPIIGMRSFGEDPDTVAAHVRAAVRGLRKAGAVSTAKHFPGHGNTSQDTHRTFPAVTGGKDELMKSDLLPFKAAIEEGVDIIMTSHIMYPAFDKQFPATLSEPILQGLLRGEMGFKGVILSDSMNMGAIKKYRDPVESAVMAIKAGVDMLMLAEEHYDHDRARYLNNQKAIIKGVLHAVKTGDISEAQITQSADRILNLKRKYVTENDLSKDTNKITIVGNAEHRNKEKEIAAKTVTLVRNTKGLWPIVETDSVAVINTVPKQSYSILTETRGIGPNQAEPAYIVFRNTLEGLRRSVVFLSYEELTEKEHLPDTLQKVDKIIAITENYPLAGVDFDLLSQQRIIKKISSLFIDKIIIIGLRSSYELAMYPEVSAYLCTFSSRPCAAEAAALAVAGKINPQGQSPVTVPGA